MESLFTIIIIVAVIEIILAAKWSSFYFNVGIPLFIFEVNRTNPASSFPSVTTIESNLSSSWHVPIKLNAFSSNEIGVREAFWGGFTKISYTPVMHGMLTFSSDRVRITGLANWFTIMFTVGGFYIPFAGKTTNHSAAWVFPIFLIGLLGFIFIIQAARYRGVAKIAANL